MIFVLGACWLWDPPGEFWGIEPRFWSKVVTLMYRLPILLAYLSFLGLTSISIAGSGVSQELMCDGLLGHD